MSLLPCAAALDAAQRAERLAEWKERGPVKDAALKAAKRAEAAFVAHRLEYWNGILK